MYLSSLACVLSIIGAGASFALTTLQSFKLVGVGTDHFVHKFLVRAVRRNRHRLFDKIPGILNETHCGALPIYLHWLLSWLKPNGLFWAERLINPIVSSVHVLLVAIIVWCANGEIKKPEMWAGLVACTFALTPQFFHAFSARNFGFSARSPGLLFLTTFLSAVYAASTNGWPAWIGMAVSAWLVLGVSTFAMQAMVIFALLLFLLSGSVMPLCGVGLGLLCFIALHPRYSIAYLLSTRTFIVTYAREIAPIYILVQRFSVWRDLVWDVWIAFRGGPRKGARYAYENSILIVLLLNPMVPLACWAYIGGYLPEESLGSFAGAVATAGALAVVLTSFRATRFLGEPERYAEAAGPWATIAGVSVLWDGLGMLGVFSLLITFLFVDILQLLLSRMLLKHIRGKQTDYMTAIEIIDRLDLDVRLCSNNEQITKMLMIRDWSFACCISASNDYCGMFFTKAFSTYPVLRRESLERIVESCRINVCVLDRSLYDSIFTDSPDVLVGIRKIYESETLRVIALDWSSVVLTTTNDKALCP